jgi:hypothetical protein
MRTIFFESDCCSLCFYEEKKLGVGVCEGFLNQEQYREAFQQGLNMIKKRKLTRFLLDNRRMKAIRQMDQIWTVEVVVPELNRSTLRRVAVIRSADIFNRMAIRSLYSKADPSWKFDGASFDNEYQAMRWLEDGIPLLDITGPHHSRSPRRRFLNRTKGLFLKKICGFQEAYANYEKFAVGAVILYLSFPLDRIH